VRRGRWILLLEKEEIARVRVPPGSRGLAEIGQLAVVDAVGVF
jgi:hypothetical protein